MARDISFRGQDLRLDDSHLLGEGGEAEIFDLRSFFPGSQALAMKLWKPPNHSDYAGDTPEKIRNRDAAKARLSEYRDKLSHFPRGLPSRVVSPKELVTNRAGVTIGYVMELIKDTIKLRQLGFKQFRDDSKISTEAVVKVFMDLHRTVEAVHKAGVVIGDFNYLNVLVRGLEAYLIDADSLQYGKWLCRSYTTRFVDPLLCDPKEVMPVLGGKHNVDSDWYAYALMLFECLMLVPLYGGVHSPKKGGNIAHEARPLKRISIHNSEVIYPKKGVPLSWLPSQVDTYFGELVSADKRGPIPYGLLDILLAKAQGKYIDPATVVPQIMKREVIRGKVKSARLLELSPGVIVNADVQFGKLALVYHKDGAYFREDDTQILKSPLNKDFKFRVSLKRTAIGFGDKLAILDGSSNAPSQYGVDTFQGQRPVFDSNAEHIYWLEGGVLYRDDHIVGQKRMGNVFQNQTQFWVGPKFGFGFYRVGGLTTGFVFDAKRTGINDSVAIPAIRGELIEALCYFSSNRAWFLTTTREGRSITNRCVSITAEGKVSQVVEAEDGSNGWLGSIHEKWASTINTQSGDLRHRLFSLTDNSLVGIDDVHGSLQETTKYSDAHDFLDSALLLLPGGGESAFKVSRDEVRFVTFT